LQTAIYEMIKKKIPIEQDGFNELSVLI